LTTIGIDYTAALQQGGGIGRYVRSLISGLADVDWQVDYRLFAMGHSKSTLPNLPGENFSWHPTPISDAWFARLWHRARLPIPIELWTGSLDLLHAPDFTLPPVRKGTRTLLTVHDLSFIRAPETATDNLRAYLNNVVPRSVHRADHILADSAATKHDLITLYNVPTEKVSVLYSGVEPRFKPLDGEKLVQDVRKKYGIGKSPFILSLGTVQPRKNYVRLVQAFAQLDAPDFKLIIVGGKGWLSTPLFEEIGRLNLNERVQLPGFADDEDLPALYNAAELFVYPSLYEGFGLPPLEAMACGTPVVVSNTSSLPEVVGEAGLLVDPLDVGAIAQSMQLVLSDASLYQTLRQKGLEQASQFTWTKAASELVGIYQDLLS